MRTGQGSLCVATGRVRLYVTQVAYSETMRCDAYTLLKFISVRNELETSVGRLDKKKGEIDLFGHQGLFRSQ